MFRQLDFADFHCGDENRRHQLCLELVTALKERGFVRLSNIGVSPSEIDKAFEASRHFFHLPLQEKLKSPHPPTANPHRGYTAFGIENVSAISNHDSKTPMPLLKDMKESYDMGSERDGLYSNVWPPAGVYDAFQPTFTSFFEACYEAELAVLEAISIGLELPEQTLSGLHKDQTNELRITHYPAMPRAEFAHSMRIAAHTDFGTVTLLFQDSVGGLQVESPSGSGNFRGIESGGQDECILNVGDCLQLWTGLHSARHRVHLPEALKEVEAEAGDDNVAARFSIAYFAKPDRNAILRPLLDTAGSEDREVYMTAGEFQDMRIQGTY